MRWLFFDSLLTSCICASSSCYILHVKKQFEALRYTNADLKISLYDCIYIKIIPWRFRILNPKSFPVIYSQNLRNVSLQAYRNHMIRYIVAYFLRKTQTLQENNFLLFPRQSGFLLLQILFRGSLWLINWKSMIVFQRKNQNHKPSLLPNKTDAQHKPKMFCVYKLLQE